MKRFFYIDDSGKRKGPNTIEQLKEHFLLDNTLVWTDGLEKWIVAGRVHLLRDIIHKPPPPLDLVDTGEIESVTIGTQVWMKRNLDVSHFLNGEPIHEVKTNEEWEKAGQEGKPAWCFYNNDPEKGQYYSRLYNWFAVNDPRGLAPEGWHVPSDKEWIQLTDYDESGFVWLPGGSRSRFGYFYGIGIYGFCWSSSEHSSSEAWVKSMWDEQGRVGFNVNKACGFSVRCLQD